MSLKPVAAIMAQIRRREVEGLTAAAMRVGEQADKNAPKDTRGLVQSRRIEVDAGKRRAEISYGKGLDDPRAVINHEKTEIHHDTGEAKYLERAMAQELPNVRRLLASTIKKTTG